MAGTNHSDIQVQQPGRFAGFKSLFEIDVRSLALLRISVALVLLYDLIYRYRWISVLYADNGVITREQSLEWLGPGAWSLYGLLGTTAYGRSLVLVTGVAAIFLLVGFKTRFMTVLCLVLVWSLHVRNPLVLTGGHVLMRMMLFWMVFLPTARVWSVDASLSQSVNRGQEPYWVVRSLATAAILLQLTYMYLFSGIAKLNSYWLDGNALQYTLQLEMYAKPFGNWLAQYPEFLQWATLGTLVAELAGPVLMFLPVFHSFFRGLFMGIFWMLHIAVWLSLSIGIFSAMAMCAWVIFVPSDVWNLLLGKPRHFDEQRLREKSRPSALRFAVGVSCAVFLIYITLQNIDYTMAVFRDRSEAAAPQPSTYSASLERFGRTTMTIQQFRMFDTPPLVDPWYEYDGILSDGTRSDVFPNRIDERGRPDSVYDYLKNQYWRRLHWNLTTHPDRPPNRPELYKAIRSQLLNNVVQRWEYTYPGKTIEFAILKCHLDPIVVGDDQAMPGGTEVWAEYRATDNP